MPHGTRVLGKISWQRTTFGACRSSKFWLKEPKECKRVRF